MSGEDYKFEGWMGLGPESADGKMVWQEFPKDRKPFEENDVDIQITHSGICGSDLHTLRSGWGPTPYVCQAQVLHVSRMHANTSYCDSPSASATRS
jgi:alcohol dehydrogenase (NADP+)